MACSARAPSRYAKACCGFSSGVLGAQYLYHLRVTRALGSVTATRKSGVVCRLAGRYHGFTKYRRASEVELSCGGHQEHNGRIIQEEVGTCPAVNNTSTRQCLTNRHSLLTARDTTNVSVSNEGPSRVTKTKGGDQAVNGFFSTLALPSTRVCDARVLAANPIVSS